MDVLAAAADMAASMECHNSMMEAFRNHDDEAGVSPDLDDSDVVEPFADLMLKAACNHVKASLFMALHCAKLNYGWKKPPPPPPPTLSEQQNKMKWQILQIQKMKLFLNAAAEPDSCYDFADEHNCKTISWHLATEVRSFLTM